MGGRGGSFSRSADIAVSVTGSDGAEIDLSASPLKYGDKDTIIDGKVRQRLESFEDKRYKAKIEFNRLVDADGKIIEENRGGKGSVSATVAGYLKAEAVTHNHPRTGKEAGLLGGTFSTADLDVFSRYGTTMRATAAEGTYSISKLKGFNKGGFRSYYASENAKNRAAYKANLKKIDDAYYTGRTYPTYQAYLKARNGAFNGYLVSEHNSLLAGQKMYGYNYTLERRSK